MREDFLHFVWKYKIFDAQQLHTTQDEKIEILKSGLHNFDAGPDFLHAKIKIAETLWAGHVEIHIKTSDWDAHKHSEDAAYDNVILHVVYIDDRKNASTGKIPVLELQNIVPQQAIDQYNNFLQNRLWIPCADSLAETEEFSRSIWLERMLVERLEQKSDIIQKLLSSNGNNWEQTAYIWLARNFGFKTNSDPFEELAQRTPYLLFSKHQNSLLQAEALLFGQAGFLEEDFPEDDYFCKLKKEYLFLKQKYNLSSMRKESWKFLRMHPGNFPTQRIAQFAALLHHENHLLSAILKLKNAQEAEKFIMAEVSPYWKDHLLFGKTSAKKQSGKMGKESIINILINSVVPLQFCYGELRNKPQLKEQAQELLLQLPAENNIITRGWEKLGLENKNAYYSQALIQLKNNYCTEKKCLFCGIGTSILRNKKINLIKN